MPEFLEIGNDGQDIRETNYFGSEHAQRGIFYVSINAGALRLLVPKSKETELSEMASAKEVIVSRGPWPSEGRSDGYEIMFEDDSDSPYCLHLSPESFDLMLGNKDQKKIVFSVWTEDGKQFERPGYFRMVKRIPWLKPYTKK